MSNIAFTTIVPISPRTYAIPSKCKALPPNSRHRLPTRTAVTMASSDLLIIGCGVLGRLIGEQWREQHQSARIVGETRTDASHNVITSSGIIPAIQGQADDKFEHVVFCASPRGNPDYPAAVSAATHRVTDGGRFVFTSSAGVYSELGGIVSEASETASSERASKLKSAEDAALQCDSGIVLRLAGLYNLMRGPHNMWLQNARVSADGRGLINLVHYEDAASAVIAAFKLSELSPEKKGRLFLISTKELTRKEICAASMEHPVYSKYSMPTFQHEDEYRTRRYDNSWSRTVLGWKPKYESFGDFMKADIKMHAQ